MSAVGVEFTAEQVRRLGHWLSEWLDDAAPLNERVWAIRAESMVKSPTFQDVLAQVKADARAEERERCARAIEALPCPGNPPTPIAKYAFETGVDRAVQAIRSLDGGAQ